MRVGESVYAVGSALGFLDGTFTAGTVSSISRTVGKIEAIQTDAATSGGNSGGPLVNVYGEVVGINFAGYTSGENLNLAIKLSNLEQLPAEQNYSMGDFWEWIATETSRSYSPYDSSDNCYYSIVNTYQIVTGRSCSYTMDSSGDYAEGYYDTYYCYFYKQVVSEFDAYVAYLKELGFEVYDIAAYSDVTEYYYYSSGLDVMMGIDVSTDGSYIIVYPMHVG